MTFLLPTCNEMKLNIRMNAYIYIQTNVTKNKQKQYSYLGFYGKQLSCKQTNKKTECRKAKFYQNCKRVYVKKVFLFYEIHFNLNNSY